MRHCRSTQWEAAGRGIRLRTLSQHLLYYTYDLLNNVTQVTMPRSTGTQTRTFNHNNTAYLKSANNPENGTVTYTYTAAGNLPTKTDAKGQKIVYT
jgi:YD repeat-containing protein